MDTAGGVAAADAPVVEVDVVHDRGDVIAGMPSEFSRSTIAAYSLRFASSERPAKQSIVMMVRYSEWERPGEQATRRGSWVPGGVRTSSQPPPQRTTAVTVARRASTSWLIEPRRKRAIAPRPCVPTTVSVACWACALITCDG